MEFFVCKVGRNILSLRRLRIQYMMMGGDSDDDYVHKYFSLIVR